MIEQLVAIVPRTERITVTGAGRILSFAGLSKPDIYKLMDAYQDFQLILFVPPEVFDEAWGSVEPFFKMADEWLKEPEKKEGG